MAMAERDLQLSLPLCPARGQQVECNAPLSTVASLVWVDRSTAPVVEPAAALASASSQSRLLPEDYRAEVAERVRRHERAQKQHRREHLSQLESTQGSQVERARVLAQNASVLLARSLPSTAKHAKPPHRNASMAQARTSGPEVRSELYAHASRLVKGVHDAKDALRGVMDARVGPANAPANRNGGGSGDAPPRPAARMKTHSKEDPMGAHANAYKAGVPVPQPSPPPRPGTPSATAGSAPPRGVSSSVAARSVFPSDSTPPAQWGRSSEELVILKAVRREQMAAERAFAKEIALHREEREVLRRRRERAAKRAAAEQAQAQVSLEVRCGAAVVPSAGAPSFLAPRWPTCPQAGERLDSDRQRAAAAERKSRVDAAVLEGRQAVQAKRYSEALRATLRERMDKLDKPLPPLCACGSAHEALLGRGIAPPPPRSRDRIAPGPFLPLSTPPADCTRWTTTWLAVRSTVRSGETRRATRRHCRTSSWQTAPGALLQT